MPEYMTEFDAVDLEGLHARLDAAEKAIVAKDRLFQRLGEQNATLRKALRETLLEIDTVEHYQLRLKDTGRVIRMIKAALKEIPQ